VTLQDPFRQVIDPGGLLLDPSRPGGGDQRIRYIEVAADHPGVEKAECRAEVV